MLTAVVPVKRLRESAIVPGYQTDGASGFDLHADNDMPLVLTPGMKAMVPTGLAVAVPEGFELQVRPRSGLAAKHGITVLNTPGTVDSDYRGEMKVIIANLGNEPFTIHHGERIAQGVICPVVKAQFVETETLDETERGAGGFGSTGTHGG